MVDVGEKPSVHRRAVAQGRIILGKRTLEAIRKGDVKKGDVLGAAQLAGIQAAKRCPDIVPLCHPVPLTGISVDLDVERYGLKCTCVVNADYRTGVEMEALCGVAGALLCVWDMVKYLEKDPTGNYPATAIADIRVLSKDKGSTGRANGAQTTRHVNARSEPG